MQNIKNDKYREIKVFIVGLGSIGRRHAANLHSLGVQRLGGFDPAPQAAIRPKEVGGLQLFQSFEEGLEWKPEVVVVTTPPDSHIPIASAAADVGAHLFIEKPLSNAFDGIDELSGKVRSRNLITMVGCNMRFHPGPALIKQIFDQGRIGKVFSARIQTGSYLPDWHPYGDYKKSYSASKEQGGGAILDCIHEIDLAVWFFGAGDVVGSAALIAESIGLNVEGLAEILIFHTSGVLSNVHLNFVQRDYRRSCQVIGENGTIYWDFEKPTVRVCLDNKRWKDFKLPSEWDINEMYQGEMRYFLEHVQGEEQTFCSLEQGLEVLRLALSAKNRILGQGQEHGVTA